MSIPRCQYFQLLQHQLVLFGDAGRPLRSHWHLLRPVTSQPLCFLRQQQLIERCICCYGLIPRSIWLFRAVPPHYVVRLAPLHVGQQDCNIHRPRLHLFQLSIISVPHQNALPLPPPPKPNHQYCMHLWK